MTNEHNPHYYATVDNDDTSIAQITDAVDFPHTGLIKALSLGIKGNYAVKGSATDFDITQSTGTNKVVVAAGKIFRDGALHTVATKNFEAASFQATANTHHLLVADSATPPVLQIRKHGSSTQNAIPPYTEGDTIIAVITYTTGFNAMNVQFLTTGKVANNVSIGYDSSGYTEAMSISASAGDTTIENKVADKDIIFKVNDATAGSVVDRLILYGENDSSYPNTEVKIEGSLLVTEDLTANKLSIGYGNSPSNGVAQISSYSATEDIAFTVGSGSPERLRIKAADGKVGIGTTTPSSSLEIQDGLTTTGAVLTLSTKEPSVVANDVLGQIDFQAPLDTGADSDLVGASIQALATATFSDTVNATDLILKTGASETATEKVRITSDGKVGIGTASPDANAKLSVEGAISLDEISAPTNTASRGQLYTNADNHLHFINGAGTDVKVTEEVFIVALSDETTNLATGTAKASFHMPFAMTLTGVKANCTTAPVGATIIVDINEAGSTILSTKLSIDASELTSSTAASAAVISDTALANDALITFDIDQVGSSTAGKGLKVTLYGVRA